MRSTGRSSNMSCVMRLDATGNAVPCRLTSIYQGGSVHSISTNIRTNHSGDAPPRHVRITRTLYGHSDRTLCGPPAALVVAIQAVIATITSDADDFAREAVEAARKLGYASNPTFATKRSTTKSESTRSPRCLPCWSSARKKPPTGRSRSAALARKTNRSCRSMPP